MASNEPVVDGRESEELLERSRRIAPFYTTEWDPDSDDAGSVLLEIFSRMAADVVDRLDRVPEKHRVSFFDTLGFGRQPPQPSRVPLVVRVAENVGENVPIPAGTQAVAEATETTPETTFEVVPEGGFEATPATIERVYSVDPAADRIVEHWTALQAGSTSGLFDGTNLQEHALYLAHGDLLTLNPGSTIQVTIRTDASEAVLSTLVWSYYGTGGDAAPGEGWHEFEHTWRDDSDGTESVVELTLPATGELVETTVDGTESRWLRVATPAVADVDELTDHFGVAIDDVALGTGPDRLDPDDLLANDVPLSTGESDDLLVPLGETPRVLDACYLGSAEALTKKGAAVAVTFVGVPAVVFVDQEIDGPSVTVQSATLPHGGFVAVYDTSAGAEPSAETLLGVTSHLDAGTHDDVAVPLSDPTDTTVDWSTLEGERQFTARLHRDTDGDGDGNEVVDTTDDDGSALGEAYRLDGEVVSATATVRSGDDGPQPTVTFRPQRSDGTTVTVETVVLAEAGFVAVSEGTPVEATEPTDVVGVSAPLDAGSHRDVEITLFDVPGGTFDRSTLAASETLTARLHRDTDGDGVFDYLASEGSEDGPYTDDAGSDVADSAVVTVEELPEPGLSWEYWDGSAWSRIDGLDDGTDRLRSPGQVAFTVPDDLAPTTVAGHDGHWIRARLVSGEYVRVTYEETDDGDLLTRTVSGEPPRFGHVSLRYEQRTPPRHLRTHNNLAWVDPRPGGGSPGAGTDGDGTGSGATTTTDGIGRLTPFVRLPDRTQALYVGTDRPLEDGPITLLVTRTDVEYADGFHPRIRWEYRTADAGDAGDEATDDWIRLDTQDGTESLTERGIVRLVFPEATPQTTRFDHDAHWIRARVTGTEFTTGAADETSTPSESSLPSASTTATTPVAITAVDPRRGRVVVENRGDAVVDLGGHRMTFACVSPDVRPGVFPDGTTIGPGGALVVGVGRDSSGESSTAVDVRLEHAVLDDRVNVVTIRTPDGALVAERTAGLPSPCDVTVETAPPGGAPTTDPPALTGLSLNAGWASNVTTVQTELLGSSDGTQDQTFDVSTPPVVDEEVWVDERSALSERARAELTETQPDAIEAVTGARDELREFWVRWTRVEDFLSVAADARAYTVDPLTGVIAFGDGVDGAIPPIGRDNVRASYRTGGGTAGNVPADTITSLTSSVPFVDSITNPEAGDGGAAAESTEAVLTRAPRELRDRGRAVTPADFERVAMDASRTLAKVRCLPGMDEAGERSPGWVTLLIVPSAGRRKPVPSVELKRQVVEAVGSDAPVTLTAPDRLVVRGPNYVEVSVETEVVAAGTGSVSTLEETVTDAIDDFLHPLTGGSSGDGWAFGSLPCLSDLYALLEGIDGVDHVADLVVRFEGSGAPITVTEGGSEPSAASDALVCSGRHDVVGRGGV